MTRRTVKHVQRVTTAAALLVVLVMAGYAIRKHGAHSASPEGLSTPKSAQVKHPPTIISDYKAPSVNVPGVDRVLRITPDTVLASINGHVLTARDVLPPGASDQNISLEACEYFRQRAVDRELIFQTAKAQQIGLNESQQQQLAKLQRERQQPGPGFVRDLAGGPENLPFELLDDEAFMLQTSLMEKAGASPNVTSQQISDYYHLHASEFRELPEEESARQEAWSQIDFKIRQILAFNARSDFQRKLTDYMKRIEIEADIQLTPLASFAEALQ